MRPAGLNPPAAVSVACGSSTSPSATGGIATFTSSQPTCTAGPVSYSDSAVSYAACPPSFTRTFSATGAGSCPGVFTATQVISFNDGVPPVLTLTSTASTTTCAAYRSSPSTKLATASATDACFPTVAAPTFVDSQVIVNSCVQRVNVRTKHLFVVGSLTKLCSVSGLPATAAMPHLPRPKSSH